MPASVYPSIGKRARFKYPLRPSWGETDQSPCLPLPGAARTHDHAWWADNRNHRRRPGPRNGQEGPSPETAPGLSNSVWTGTVQAAEPGSIGTSSTNIWEVLDPTQDRSMSNEANAALRMGNNGCLTMGRSAVMVINLRSANSANKLTV